jgi:hypothetical protein
MDLKWKRWKTAIDGQGYGEDKETRVFFGLWSTDWKSTYQTTEPLQGNNTRSTRLSLNSSPKKRFVYMLISNNKMKLEPNVAATGISSLSLPPAPTSDRPLICSGLAPGSSAWSPQPSPSPSPHDSGPSWGDTIGCFVRHLLGLSGRARARRSGRHQDRAGRHKVFGRQLEPEGDIRYQA